MPAPEGRKEGRGRELLMLSGKESAIKRQCWSELEYLKCEASLNVLKVKGNARCLNQVGGVDM